MIYLFLDESGDLGFDFTKKGVTKKFVITILACFSIQARKEFRTAIKRTIKNKINVKKKKKQLHELKGAKTGTSTKKYFFKNIKRDDWAIYTLVLNKKRVNEDLRTKRGKKKLYNFLSRILIEKIDYKLKQEKEKVELIVDKSKNSEEIKDFNQYLENQLHALLPLEVPLNIYHLESFNSKELQAVDLFCWGIFRKYEKDDPEWYNLFKAKIEYESEYLR